MKVGATLGMMQNSIQNMQKSRFQMQDILQITIIKTKTKSRTFLRCETAKTKTSLMDENN